MSSTREQHETDAFYAGVLQARGVVSTRRDGSRYRPRLEVMCRDRIVVEAFRDHFGGVGKIVSSSPPYNENITNYVWRVQGAGAQDVLTRLQPYLVGFMSQLCKGVSERCQGKAA